MQSSGFVFQIKVFIRRTIESISIMPTTWNRKYMQGLNSSSHQVSLHLPARKRQVPPISGRVYAQVTLGVKRKINDIISQSGKITYIEEPLIKYRQHKNNKVGSKKKTDELKSIDEITKINKQYREKYNIYKKEFQNLSEVFHSFFK